MSTPERSPTATGRRQFATVVLAAAGACGVLLLSIGRPWLDAAVVTAGMPRRDITVTGAEAMPWLRGAALVALAGVATWLVASGVLRRCLGAVVLLAGAVVAVAAATAGPALSDALAAAASATAAGADPEAAAAAVDQAVASPWRWVTVAAAVGLALSGLAVVLLAGGWPGWSRRYEAPASSRAPGPAAAAAAGDPAGDPAVGAPAGTPGDTAADPAANPAPDPAGDPAGEPAGDAAGRTDAQDLWRELDAGRDPTR